MKKCTKCGVEKTLDSFNKDKNHKDGLQYKCKDCRKAYHEANKEKIAANSKVWREANKGKAKAYSKVYYEANKEKIAATCKVYYEANIEALKDQMKAYSKVYYEANKEKVKAYHEANKEKIAARHKLWIKNNPEKCRESVRKRRAMKVLVNENYTKEDEAFTKNLFDHACFNCGSTENLEIDHHKPLHKGNALTRTNAVVLCKSCNGSGGKWRKDPEEFYSEEQIMIIQEVFDSIEEQV